MSRPKFQGPLKQTPKVVSTGKLSKPVPQPKPSFQGALLPQPPVTSLKPRAWPA